VRQALFGSGALSLVLGLLSVSCGSRTELWEAEQACSRPGAERPCQNACGTGSQVCESGLWSQCEVASVTRSCTDGCGQAEQSCVDGSWQACEVPLVQRPCESVCGPGHETCHAGIWGKCDAPLPKPPQLKATIRDFSPTTHPDFEAGYVPGLDVGIVERELGADDTPVYAGKPFTKSTSGPINFGKWYHDDPVNLSAPLDLQLAVSKNDPNLFEYDNHAFFPIDGQLLGNEGRNHNYHFTLAASTNFVYRKGDEFAFSGDDDMWVFINRQLAIDLGGLHQTLSATLVLDDIAPEYGLAVGQSYPLHFFFAERHTTQSNFTLRTSIADPGSCN
jgi:fibro-slime domain-containing protein